MIDETYKNCCGCGGCFAICPTNAITMQYDYEGFLDSGVYLRRSCYSCPLNIGFGLSDIHLGDAWGSEFLENKAGVSRIIIASEKGQAFFEKAKGQITYGVPEKRIIMSKSNQGKIYESVRSRIASDIQTATPIKKMLRRYWRAYPLRSKMAAIMPTSMLRLLKKVLKEELYAK